MEPLTGSQLINCSMLANADNSEDVISWCVKGVEDTFPPTLPLNFIIQTEGDTQVVKISLNFIGINR